MAENHILPPYGVAIQKALASNDVAHMREVAERAESHAANDPEIREALGRLKAEIQRMKG